MRRDTAFAERLMCSSSIRVSASEDEWADEMLKAMRENIPIRRSHAKEVADAGFDSASEALRLQNYYLNAIKEASK